MEFTVYCIVAPNINNHNLFIYIYYKLHNADIILMICHKHLVRTIDNTSQYDLNALLEY